MVHHEHQPQSKAAGGHTANDGTARKVSHAHGKQWSRKTQVHKPQKLPPVAATTTVTTAATRSPNVRATSNGCAVRADSIPNACELRHRCQGSGKPSSALSLLLQCHGGHLCGGSYVTPQAHCLRRHVRSKSRLLLLTLDTGRWSVTRGRPVAGRTAIWFSVGICGGRGCVDR